MSPSVQIVLFVSFVYSKTKKLELFIIKARNVLFAGTLNVFRIREKS